MTPTTDAVVLELVNALQSALLEVQIMRRRLQELDSTDGAAATAGFQRALTALSTLRGRGFGKVE